MASSPTSRDPSTTADADTNLSTPNNPPQLRSQDVPIPQVFAHHNTTLPFRSVSYSAPIVDQQLQPPSDATTIVTTTHSQPILIPPVHPSLSRRDPNRVHTPVSGRGDKQGHLFPFPKTPPPHDESTSLSKSRKSHSSPESDDFFSGWSRQRRRSSSSTYSHHIFSMQTESRYTPTSPLSPKLRENHRPLSPQPTKRVGHVRHPSRNLQMNLPRYHPANYIHDTAAATPSSTVQSPAITLNRVTQSVELESPRTMREKHREFLDSVRLSSKNAASPFTQKPGPPRLDPLGSPKGVVTPLALEEAADYFAATGAGRRSPVGSPGGRSDGSSGKEEGVNKNKRKVDVFEYVRSI